MKVKCPTCGVRFERIVPWKRYCSDRCRVVAFQRRNPDRVRAYKQSRKEKGAK